MSEGKWKLFLCAGIGAQVLLGFAAYPTVGQLNLGPEELVQAGGADIIVNGYSVPSFVYWDADNLKDLVVGEGGTTAKVRVYLNGGTESNPQFSNFFYAQSNGSDLVVTGAGCLGCFPRTVYWDADGKKDLLIGQSNGMLKLFSNIGTDANPTFNGGAFLQAGAPGAKTNIDVGDRATSTVVDYNSDGKKDLVVGELGGKIHIYLNQGTDTSPDFVSKIFAQQSGADLIVDGTRSSPAVLDLDNDGKKDLLTGNTNGKLLFYSNTGTDIEPSFSGYEYVKTDGFDIQLPNSPRSRPFVCDWTNDGLLDVLIGAGDVGGGKIHLYQGVPEPATLTLLALSGLIMLRRRRC